MSFSWSQNFTGIQKDEMSKIIYARAAQKVDSILHALFRAMFPVPIIELSPFLLVLVHLGLGTYSIDSWLTLYHIWWGQIVQLSCIDHLFFRLIRIPFELNSSFRCACATVYESFSGACFTCVNFVAIAFLVGSMTYLRACWIDLKSIFDVHIGTLNRESVLEMAEYVKEAVDLHNRVIR